MSRVSLKEAYDNKDVVAQIFAIRDIAEGAEDTADSAVTTANTASAHVDALVPQVEGAVESANNASASAQTSAQTVAGYENRLSAVEGEVSGLDSDLGAVTLRVTTAEGQIVTIQGRVTALEGADAQNVKLAGNQTITGIKTVPTEATGSRSQQIANSAKVGAELDNYAPMVRTTGNQTISGVKTLTGTVNGGDENSSGGNFILWGDQPFSKIQIKHRVDDVTVTPASAVAYPNVTWRDKNGVVLCVLTITHNTDGTVSLTAQVRNTNGQNKAVQLARSDVI